MKICSMDNVYLHYCTGYYCMMPNYFPDSWTDTSGYLRRDGKIHNSMYDCEPEVLFESEDSGWCRTEKEAEELATKFGYAFTSVNSGDER